MMAPKLIDFMNLVRNLEAEGFGEVSSLAQASALCRIDDATRGGSKAGIAVGRLAHHELVSVPTMSKLVSALEDRGLVAKRPDPRDSRGVIVSATEAGVRAARIARSRFSSRFKALS